MKSREKGRYQEGREVRQLQLDVEEVMSPTPKHRPRHDGGKIVEMDMLQT